MLSQGRYTPGEDGAQQRRENICKQLVEGYPALRQAIETHAGSMKWFRHRLLSFDDRLAHGFVSIATASEIIRVDVRLDTPSRRLKERWGRVLGACSSFSCWRCTRIVSATAAANP